MRNPLNPAAVIATVAALISMIPVFLIFVSPHVSTWVAERFIYAIPLAMFGTPGATIVYGETRAGLKYIPLVLVVNWMVYFVFGYLICWFWFASKYLCAQKRSAGSDE